ncbi:ABC transporter permease [bacterium]|nr:ABC transporter permease [bacterium]
MIPNIPPMARYLMRRFMTGLVTLFGITIITFVIIKLAPGDPAQARTVGLQGKRVSERVYQQLREYYGLDQPVYVQYYNWMDRLCHLDFGTSFYDGRAVASKIRDALWPTMSVAILSILLAFIISTPIGIYSAARQNGPFDRSVSTTLYMVYSIPSYVIGMLLILYLGVKLELFPFRGMHSDNYAQLSTLGKCIDLGRHYFMITVCETVGSLAYYSRFVRQNLLEVIRQDYIRTARAKGLSETQVILKHAFVNSLIPFITLLGLTFPALLSGSVILETMFNWPGLGRLFFESVLQRDYPTLMALNFITAVMVLAGTLLADLAYGLVDPRVSYD